jgi:hypothetical protein
MYILVNWSEHVIAELPESRLDCYVEGHGDGVDGNEVTIFEYVAGEGMMQRYPEVETEPEPGKAEGKVDG